MISQFPFKDHPVIVKQVTYRGMGVPDLFGVYWQEQFIGHIYKEVGVHGNWHYGPQRSDVLPTPKEAAAEMVRRWK